MAEIPRSILPMLGITCLIINIVSASETSTRFLKSSLSLHSKGGDRGVAEPSTSQFLSIDCGRPDPTPYADVFNVTWVGDSAYVQTGNNATIPNDYTPFATIRYFPTGVENCYTVPAGFPAGTKLLVRAAFTYGNYDNKSSPPTFKISLDGSLGLEIQTVLEYPVLIEVIYTTKTDNTSVCLLQSVPDNFPLISSLEFRALSPDMYTLGDPNYANYSMIKYSRSALGSPYLLRYPFDAYDRFWSPYLGEGGITNANSTVTSFANTSDVHDQPPVGTFLHAITPSDPLATTLQIPLAFPITATFYLNFHFSEVVSTDTVRSFNLLLNGQVLNGEPIVPPYQGVLALYSPGFSIDENSTFTLERTSNSTLPPLINAMEFYVLVGPPTNGTNPTEGLPHGVCIPTDTNPCT